MTNLNGIWLTSSSRRDIKTDRRGQVQRPLRIDNNLLSYRASDESHYPVSSLEGRNALSDSIDDARTFSSRHERRLELRLIAARDDQPVGKIDAGGMQPYSYLAGARLGCRQIPHL